MAGVKYIAPFFDGSGYAEAARNYALSIHRQGYPITITPITFERTRPDLGKDGELLTSLVNNGVYYDKVIVHSTPDLWEHWTRGEQGKYLIGYTVWETSHLHPTWVVSCNRADEVWLPCEWNMNLFKESGVKVPLFKVPHAIDVPDLNTVPNFNLEGISEDTFVFYSIFQWQERKNPYGLLAAYYSAFTGVEDVVLIMKTYRHDHEGDQTEIRNIILQAKKHMNLDHYPRIFLIVENMSKENMMALHKRGDCFVLLQRSEGWGLPHFEAAACGKPVITPGYGGQTDFLSKDNSYVVNHTLCPVTGMGWSPYYRSDQYWCEPDMKHAIETMRYVYKNRSEIKEKGQQARQGIVNEFTWDKVGKGIVDRLKDLDGGPIDV